MNRDRSLLVVETHSQRLVDAAVRDLDAAVPDCPGWVAMDVVEHTGIVYAHKVDILRDQATESPDIRFPPPDDDVVDWYRAERAEMLDLLGATDPSTPMWTWHEPDQTAGFWLRRMVHETVIHCLDAERATGTAGPIDVDVAADGVDEILTAMLTGCPDWAEPYFEETYLDLVATDADQSWTLREMSFTGTSPHSGTHYVDEPGYELVPETATNVTVAGPAVDLLLWLWGRGPLESLDVRGDRAHAEALRELARTVTQ